MKFSCNPSARDEKLRVFISSVVGLLIVSRSLLTEKEATRQIRQVASLLVDQETQEATF